MSNKAKEYQVTDSCSKCISTEILHISEVARRENVSPEAIRKRIKFGWYEEVPNPNMVEPFGNTIGIKP